MKSKVFLWIILFVIVLLAFIFCNIKSFAGYSDYSFLSPEANKALEDLKWKYYGVKEIICKKEEGEVWVIILPKNDGVKTEEVKEKVYSEEGKFEGLYKFTNIIIKNPQGWISVVWGPAAEFYPRNVPKICVRFDS